MTGLEVEILIREAIEAQFIGVCVPPFWIRKVKRELGEQDIQLVTVIGFPFGYQDTATKVFETKNAIKEGADELDLVWSQTAYHSGMNWEKIEIAQISKICHEEGKVLKVIVETANLSQEQLVEACKICEDAGADFVKTSTGYASSGAKVEDILLMRSRLASTVGIKASGGIKTLDFALELIRAGADRIGTSSAKSLMKEWQNKARQAG
jgi:deoxyribose-phosphate aldolase